MNGTRSTELKVGVGVILAAIILILGVIWIGNIRFNQRWEAFTVYFNEVGGLSVGDPVTVSGLKMGRVNSIALDGGRVKVGILIRQGVVLRSDLEVQIQSIGLMGERFIHILPGSTGGILPPGSTIEGQYKAGLPEAVAELGDTMEQARTALKSINDMLMNIESQTDLGADLARLGQVAGEILAMLNENRADVRSATRSMKAAAGDAEAVLGSRKEKIETGIDGFSRAAARLDSLTVELADIVARVKEGKGSLGMLINDKTLFEDTETAIHSLNDLLVDIKAHPERYIRIEIF
jgi:phospholipid/cholesterol/gamma-HCH transport system substrate-binding protein